MPSLSDLAKIIEDPESDLVTLVKRQIVYSEIVISRKEFEEIQKSDDNYEDYEDLKEKMITDECMKYLGDEEETWMLFSGDVTSASDDLICWTDKEWDDFWFLK